MGKGLAPAEILVARTRRLISFFNSPKQIERLKKAQERCSFNEILMTIKGVSTRWNSTYYAWERLLYLHDAITSMITSLTRSQERDARQDGQKLRRYNLTDEEWNILEKVLDILAPFEEATRLLSGSQYSTLSHMYPVISKLSEIVIPLDLSTPIQIIPENQATILDQDENIYIQETSIDNNSENETNDNIIVSAINNEQLPITSPQRLDNLEEKIKSSLYLALIHYWDMPKDTGLLASLLDPRWKNLDFIDSSKKQDVHTSLHEEYQKLLSSTISEVNSEPIRTSNLSDNMQDSHRTQNRRIRKSFLFEERTSQESNYIDDPISYYLRLPQIRLDSDPFEWWKQQSMDDNRLGQLRQLVKKFLAIPATSAESERVFSDTGRIITPLRARLDAETVRCLVFLKRNMKFCF